MLSVLLFSTALNAAVLPVQKGNSRVELSMASCGDEDDPILRMIDRRNEWFEVIEHYDQPLQVVRFSASRKSNACLEGPLEASVDVQVSAYPRDGSAPTTGKTLRVDGEDPKVVDQLSWALLKVTSYGCCGSHDGYTWIDPSTTQVIATSSTEPLPLQVINRDTPQGSVWRFAFGQGSLSVLAKPAEESTAHVIAELAFLGMDRAASRYSIEFTPANDDEDGGWWISSMRWSGAALEDGNEQTWWIDGDAPTAAQVDGMTLEVELQCQCGAAPLKLKIPVRDDGLDVSAVGGSGSKSVKLKAL